MSSLRHSLLLLLVVGVAAPAAARSRPVSGWPGVTDVLLNLNVAAPAAIPTAVPLPGWLGINDSSVARVPVPFEKGMWCGDFALLRLVAEFNYYDGEEAVTDIGPPGVPVYQKMVEVPDGCDTLYVTISATGDEDIGTWFTCKVDFAFCNPGFGFATQTPGWISLQHNPVPFVFQEDNNINYTWCTQITPGTHAVEIRMASEQAGTGSFLETAHFYIDASNTNGGCVHAEPVEDPINPKSLLPTPRLP